MFLGRWVPKDGENISKVDKASLYKFNKFLELELGNVKARLLSA